jgi:hypothetical protein
MLEGRSPNKEDGAVQKKFTKKPNRIHPMSEQRD